MARGEVVSHEILDNNSRAGGKQDESTVETINIRKLLLYWAASRVCNCLNVKQRVAGRRRRRGNRGQRERETSELTTVDSLTIWWSHERPT